MSQNVIIYTVLTEHLCFTHFSLFR